jgi:hypothetical protein
MINYLVIDTLNFSSANVKSKKSIETQSLILDELVSIKQAIGYVSF